MSKKLSRLTAVLFALLVLSACTTTPEDCDPSVELNVFNKAACKMSGSYDKRIEQKEKILLDEKATNKQFRAIYADIQRQQASSNKSVAQKRAELNKLNKSLYGLTSQLKSKAQGQKQILADINAVEAQMKSVNNSDASEVEKQVELQKLQKKLSTLQSAVGLK